MLEWVLNTPMQTDTELQIHTDTLLIHMDVNIWNENNQLDVMKYGIE